MDFSFATASMIRFGIGVVGELAGHSARLGSRAFLVTGASSTRTAAHTTALPVKASYELRGEPTFDDVRGAVIAVRTAGADHVIGIGGGAVLDLAKVVAILAASGADPMEHAEVIGAGRPLPERAMPFIAVPTTAGTGAEVTSNAVLTSMEHRVKVSLRSPAMLADVALVDPMLTRDPGGAALTAYAVAAEAITGDQDVEALLSWLTALESRLQVPPLDLVTENLESVVDGAQRASSMKGNPIELTRAELRQILQEATQPRGR